jgi:hypothetical protein
VVLKEQLLFRTTTDTQLGGLPWLRSREVELFEDFRTLLRVLFRMLPEGRIPPGVEPDAFCVDRCRKSIRKNNPSTESGDDRWLRRMLRLYDALGQPPIKLR